MIATVGATLGLLTVIETAVDIVNAREVSDACTLNGKVRAAPHVYE